MNRFFFTMTSLVGAKQLTFFVAFVGVFLALMLPSRRETPGWSNGFEDPDRVLASDGSGVANLEAASAPSAAGASATRATDSPSEQSSVQSGGREGPADLAASPAVGVVRSEFRQIGISSADDFGHADRGDRLASQLVGAAIGNGGASFTPFGSGGATSTGGSGAPSKGNAGGSTGSSGAAASGSAQTRASEVAVAHSKTDELTEVIPDPSPLIPDPIPLASAPVSAPQNSPSDPNANQVASPTHTGGPDPQPLADYGIARLEDGGTGTADNFAALDPSPEAASLSSLGELSDVPGPDSNDAQQIAANHVADRGHSLLLLGGALLGVFGFRHWHSRSTRHS